MCDDVGGGVGGGGLLPCLHLSRSMFAPLACAFDQRTTKHTHAQHDDSANHPTTRARMNIARARRGLSRREGGRNVVGLCRACVSVYISYRRSDGQSAAPCGMLGCWNMRAAARTRTFIYRSDVQTRARARCGIARVTVRPIIYINYTQTHTQKYTRSTRDGHIYSEI